MRDNAFGKACKVGFVGWSVFLIYCCVVDFSKLATPGPDGRLDPGAPTAVYSLGTNTFFWLIGAVGIVLVYWMLGRSETPPAPVAPPASSAGEKACPACFSKIDARATICPHCRTEQPPAVLPYDQYLKRPRG